MLPDTLTHRRIFLGMLALPPDQIVQVAAKREGSALHAGNRNTVFKIGAALVADPAVALLRRYGAVPGDAAVSVFVETRSINWTDWLAGTRMPVLAVRPVIDQYGDAANLTEGQLTLIRRGISPNAVVAAIEAARSTIVGSAVWHQT
jgi:hypothetical protein